MENKLTETKMQELADKFCWDVLIAKYGARFVLLENIEDDDEINRDWEYLNESFYESINKINTL